MSFPAIRNSISYLSRPRKFLLLSLLIISSLSILVILTGVSYFFKFGYYRQGVPIEGPRRQGWIRGEWVDQVVGTVIEKNGKRFTIERDGERVDLEIVGTVFHKDYNEREMGGPSIPLRAMDASNIQVGQAISATKLDKNDDLNSLFESSMIVCVWDLVKNE